MLKRNDLLLLNIDDCESATVWPNMDDSDLLADRDIGQTLAKLGRRRVVGGSSKLREANQTSVKKDLVRKRCRILRRTRRFRRRECTADTPNGTKERKEEMTPFLGRAMVKEI